MELKREAGILTPKKIQPRRLVSIKTAESKQKAGLGTRPHSGAESEVYHEKKNNLSKLCSRRRASELSYTTIAEEQKLRTNPPNLPIHFIYLDYET